MEEKTYPLCPLSWALIDALRAQAEYESARLKGASDRLALAVALSWAHQRYKDYRA